MELDGELVDADQESLAHAWRIVQDHGRTGTCAGCGNGCDQLSWAHGELERLDVPQDWYREKLLAIRALMRALEAGHVAVIGPATNRTAIRRQKPAETGDPSAREET